MISKTIHMYWGGRKLSYLRYLTVKSFKKHNPSWKIKVYYPTQPTIGNTWATDEHIVEYNGSDWFDNLKDYAELVPLDMTSLGFSNDMAEVHKSAVLRLWALHEFGGVYSDMDILYTKPMPKLTQRAFCHHPDGHYPDGFLAAPKGDGMFLELLEALRPLPRDKYQAWGPTLWNNHFTTEPDGLNIPIELVYSYKWQDVHGLFNGNDGLPDGAIGVHWFGGSIEAGQWENRLTPESEHDTTIGNIVKELK